LRYAVRLVTQIQIHEPVICQVLRSWLSLLIHSCVIGSLQSTLHRPGGVFFLFAMGSFTDYPIEAHISVGWPNGCSARGQPVHHHRTVSAGYSFFNLQLG
jgi:hypothetical protein